MKQRFILIVVGLLFSIVFPRSLLGASLTVSSPNGGECFIPGSDVTISWSGDGYEHVAITHRLDNETPPTYLSDPAAWNPNHPISGSTYKWQVPNVTSSTVKLWIEAHNSTHNKIALDSSDALFTIGDSCGVDQTPTATEPTIERIIVGDRTYQVTQTVEVEKGTNLKLEGLAQSNEAVTIYVKSEEKKFTTTASSDGNWTFEVFTNSLEDGDHQVDLETASSPRAKALSFRIMPKGVVTLDTQPVVTLATTEDQSTIRRITSRFPYLAAFAIAVPTLLVSTTIYLLVRRRSKRIDETPVQPPQIT